MLDEILDLFGRKRQPDGERPPSTRKQGLPFRMPFFDDDHELDERVRHRHEDERPSGRRPSPNRSAHDDL